MALRARTVVGAAAVAFIAAALVTEGVKTDPESVHAYALERVRKQFPEARVTPLEGTEFEIVHANGRRAFANIAHAQEVCKATPRKCIDTVDDLLIGLMNWLEADTPPAPDALRPVITTRTAVDRTAVTPAEDVSDRPLTTELAGDLVIGYELATPVASMPLTDALRSRLGIARDSLRAVAIETLGSKTSEPNPSPVFGGLGIHELRGPLAASQLLVPARVGTIQRALRAQALLVAIPTREHVLIVDEASEGGAALLASMSARMYKEAAHPLTAELFVVTHEGWSLR